jgi:hypothetical protein
MKQALVITVAIFFLGLISKFFHFPFNAIIMMIGLLAMLVVLITAAITKKFSPLKLAIGFTSTLYLISLLFTLKFWPFATALLLVSGLLTVIPLTIAFKKKQVKKLMPLLICLMLSATLSIMPTDTRYYLVSIKWNQEIEQDFFSWDKYSWFLYNNGKYEEAQTVSNTALRIAKEANDPSWIDFISEHNSKIEDKSWDNFR